MNIAVLGTGRVAHTVAAKLASVGHTVVLGSRNPDAPRADREPLPPVVHVVSHAAAAASADVVFNALPGDVTLETLDTIGAERLAGKVLVDVANAIAFGDGSFALLYPNGSLGEAVQALLPETRVVKTLNTMNTSVMTDPTGLSSASSVFVSGDDAGAKATVIRLLGDLGWPAEWVIDLGGISTARGPEHAMLLLAGLFGSLGTLRFNLAVIR